MRGSWNGDQYQIEIIPDKNGVRLGLLLKRFKRELKGNAINNSIALRAYKDFQYDHYEAHNCWYTDKLGLES